MYGFHSIPYPMKKLLFHILIILWISFFASCSVDSGDTQITKPVSIAPDSMPIPESNNLGTLLNDPKAYDGYTLFTIYKATYLIDNCGRVINQWLSTYDRGGAFCLLEDGSLLRAGKIINPGLPYGGIGGVIEKFNWQGDLIWSYVYSSPSYSQHHGLVPLPNGNILFLSAHKKTRDEAILAGRNPEHLPEDGLYDERIIEIEPSGSNGGTIVWEWSTWDHLVQDYDNTKFNYGVVSENPQLLDINYQGSPNKDTDWLHFNSIQYHVDLDQIIISSQKLSEIYIIDHSTTTEEAKFDNGGNSGMGGAIMYRWGNPEAYHHGTPADRKLFGQHNAHWIPNDHPDGGKIMLFNNGLGRKTDYSSVDIIDTPKEGTFNYRNNPGEPYGPEAPDWSYSHPDDPVMFYSKILSSAQRLPNGNTLICEGTKGTFFEINEDQEIVWKYVNPITNQGEPLSQGDTTASNVFQAIKYSQDYEGFTGKDLIPGNPLELNFDIGNCK